VPPGFLFPELELQRTDVKRVTDNVSPGTDQPRQCRTQIQTVPTANGGQREITIMRC